MTNPPDIEFEVLVAGDLEGLLADTAFKGKAMMSLLNGFEDGEWRDQVFHNFIWDNITEAALSAHERQALASKPHSALNKAAKSLRIEGGRNEKGGEIAEIFLYGVLRRYYGALPIVPKIFYKQNPQDYAKGADSVHLTIGADGKPKIWLGEAKFYRATTESRLAVITKSVKAMLSSEKLRKEFNIVTSLQDIDLVCEDKAVVEEARRLLHDGISLDEIKGSLNVPIIIVHQCKDTSSISAISEMYKNTVLANHKAIAAAYFKRQDAACAKVFAYEKIKFHLILFPVPEKSRLIKAFTAEAITKRK